jgi:stearoyl-CoA desaturase (delta-9 desaturase)
MAGARAVADADMLQAVIANRYDVLAKYAKSLKATYSEEVAKLRQESPQDAEMLARFKRWLNRDHKALAAPEKQQLAEALSKSKPLETVYTMRQELTALWERSNASKEQLLKDLQDWCQRAEASGIRQLQEFSFKLRCYT